MCVSSVSIPYSWNNVSTYYNNKTFSLIFPTAATTITYSFVLPDGFYTVGDINYNLRTYFSISQMLVLFNASGAKSGQKKGPKKSIQKHVHKK